MEASQTTCSTDTARLGGNQTVVAFTFYGEDGGTYDTYDRDYFSGIKVYGFDENHVLGNFNKSF